MIKAMVSNILRYSEEFGKAKSAFQDALQKRGHTNNLSQETTQQQHNPEKSRSKYAAWFNPLFHHLARTLKHRQMIFAID